MQNISQYYKIIVIALSLTCTILLFYIGRETFDSYLMGENTLQKEAFAMPQVIAISPLPNKHKKMTPPSVAPIAVKADLSNSIWLEMSEHLNLDHRANSPQVKKQIRNLLSDKTELNRILNASTPYIYYMYTQTQARHLPAELALIPFIESNYNPHDKSNVGATGLWQLMPQTARILGIKVNKGYDGRLNVVNSTNAAFDYFRDLGKLFKNNWYLAIAAYNCGDAKVSSAVKKAGSSDYEKLALPLETRLYVPRLLAIAEIVKHPKEYGVTLPTISNVPFFKEVKINHSLKLTNYAKSAGISLDTLKKLNPDYKNGNVLFSQNANLLVPIQVHSS